MVGVWSLNMKNGKINRTSFSVVLTLFKVFGGRVGETLNLLEQTWLNGVVQHEASSPDFLWPAHISSHFYA